MYTRRVSFAQRTMNTSILFRYRISIRRYSSQVSFKLQDKHLDLLWPDGTLRSFHYAWLRDHCPCSLCVHPSNRQKLHSSADICFNTKPSSVTLDAQKMSIKWLKSLDIPSPASHESNYCLNDLKSFDNRRSHALQSVLWDQNVYKTAQNRVDYRDLSSGADGAFKTILQQLRDYGLAFVKNVPMSLTQVESLAEFFGPIRHTFYGRSWNVKSVPEAKNIAYTSLRLDLHMDLMYQCFLIVGSYRIGILKHPLDYNFCMRSKIKPKEVNPSF